MTNLRSNIEWTDVTWSPVTGCTKVSAGCKHCYAERLFPRVYPGREFGDVRVHEDRIRAPLRWRKPRMVFVNSMSDLFHEDVSFHVIDDVFDVMARADRHTFQVLTKRPQRMIEWADSTNARHDDILGGWDGRRPIPNVWLGVSVEDQRTADERIPLLLQVPAAVRFLSVEPMLGPVTLNPWLLSEHGRRLIGAKPGTAWVIVGAESGPGARPCELGWIRSIVEQCRAAHVACFVKQVQVNGRLSRDPAEWPADLRVREWPR
jgi:protein gp37